MKHSILSMIGVLTFFGIGLISSSAMAIDGPMANATVSFGQWETAPPLDRLVGDPGMGVGNNHELHPQIATIKEGGSVNFIISGGHVVTVYDDGTQPEDIDLVNIEPAANCPTSAGGVLSDSIGKLGTLGRIYRGPCFTAPLPTNPANGISTIPVIRRDGVEVVQFTKPGTYLVICARKNHFAIPNTVPQQFEMYGFVKVLPGNNK
ncbi:MAG TPA: hypothetical protein VLJ79_19670 [Candidatus Binatia bacterium]|nr:hypothetical protein [Candidatus Binatia bacterium]